MSPAWSIPRPASRRAWRWATGWRRRIGTSRARWRLARLTTDGPLDNLQDVHYTYDQAGNVAAFDDEAAGIHLSYGYDPLDRLAGVRGTYTQTYGYDPLGNLTNKAEVTQYYSGTQPHAVTGTSERQELWLRRKSRSAPLLPGLRGDEEGDCVAT